VVFRQATAAANHLPPDFTSSSAVSVPTIPLVASGASDDADWYFLAGRDQSHHTEDGKFERSVYVTQTISVREGTASPATSMSDREIQLYSIKRDGEWQAGEVIQIQNPSMCNGTVLLGYDQIPVLLQDNGADDSSVVIRFFKDYRNTIFLQKTAKELVLSIFAIGDCRTLTIDVRKLSDVLHLARGKEITISRQNSTHQIFSILVHVQGPFWLRSDCLKNFGHVPTVSVSALNFFYKHQQDFLEPEMYFDLPEISARPPVYLTIEADSSLQRCSLSVEPTARICWNCSVCETSSSIQSFTKTYRLARPPRGKVLGLVYPPSNESSFSIVATHPDIPRGNLFLQPRAWLGIPLASGKRAHFFNGIHSSHAAFDQEDVFVRIQYNFQTAGQVDFQFQLFQQYDLEENGEVHFENNDNTSFAFAMTKTSYPGIVKQIGSSSCILILGCVDAKDSTFTLLGPESLVSGDQPNSQLQFGVSFDQKCGLSLKPLTRVAIKISTGAPVVQQIDNCTSIGQWCYVVVHVVVENDPSIGAFFKFSEPLQNCFGSIENVLDENLKKLNRLKSFFSFGEDTPGFRGGYDLRLDTNTRAFSGEGTTLTIPAIPHPSKEFFLYIKSEEALAKPIFLTVSLLEDFIQKSQIETFHKYAHEMLEKTTLPQVYRFSKVSEEFVVNLNFSTDEKISSESKSYGSGWFFGSNRLKQAIMPTTGGGNVNSFYASSHDANWYLLLIPGAVKGRFVASVDPIRFLCNPLLACHGNGYCDHSQMKTSCDCIAGAGYGFSGDSCDQKVSFGMVLFLSGVILSLFLVVIVAWLTKKWIHNRKLRNARIRAHERLLAEDEIREFDVSPRASQAMESVRSHIQPCTLSVVDAQLRVKNGKEEALLLRDINLRFRPGTLTAIMGPSGSGKSTLLKVLSGRAKLTSGHVLYEGQSMSSSSLGTLVGYVPQEDILHPNLTVLEHVLHSARMRMPRSFSSAYKTSVAEAAVENVGLTPKAHFRVGDIGQSTLSGGQRRRLSVAMEMAVMPSVLFLDEPTSGLDSLASLSLMELVKHRIVSDLGITAIAVLHQPRIEILELCDQLVLLKDGLVKYQGPATIEAMKPYFPPLNNPAPEGRMINFGDMIIDQVDMFTQQPVVADLVSEGFGLKARQAAALHVQFLLQLWRSSLQIARNAPLQLTLHGLTVIVAIVLGVLFRSSRFVGGAPKDVIYSSCSPDFYLNCAAHRQDNYLTQASMISLSLGLVAISASLLTYGGIEQKNFFRESTWGQNTFAYFLAKEIVAVPNLAIAPLLFICIYQLMTAPPLAAVSFWVLMFGIYFSASGAGHFISVCLDPSKSLIVSVVFVALMSAVSGVQPSLSDLERAFGGFLGGLLPAISFIRWSAQGFYTHILKTYRDIYQVSYALDHQT